MIKKQLTYLFDTYKRLLCSLICLCYLLGAMQMPVFSLMHGFSHWIIDHNTEQLQGSSAHLHQFLQFQHQKIAIGHEHSHSHGLLSWFKQLLDETETGEGTHERLVEDLIDNHLITQNFLAIHFANKKTLQKITYIKPILPAYKGKIPTPPPQRI